MRGHCVGPRAPDGSGLDKGVLAGVCLPFFLWRGSVLWHSADQAVQECPHRACHHAKLCCQAQRLCAHERRRAGRGKAQGGDHRCHWERARGCLRGLGLCFQEAPGRGSPRPGSWRRTHRSAPEPSGDRADRIWCPQQGRGVGHRHRASRVACTSRRACCQCIGDQDHVGRDVFDIYSIRDFLFTGDTVAGRPDCERRRHHGGRTAVLLDGVPVCARRPLLAEHGCHAGAEKRQNWNGDTGPGGILCNLDFPAVHSLCVLHGFLLLCERR
mmetsp:Transcript_12479/g.29713  ORF Transcript_12479/g.29713 Transcript_12479/m.29713 type:complete len:270 (+) Transcript_12479:990-1799(+)